MKNFLEKVFKLSENNTTVKTELVAGLTTFFAMCYIVIVNPNQMTGFSAGPVWNACFVGGIIAAVVATLLMAFVANKPFALAAGMGLNSFFFVSFVLPATLSGKGPVAGYQEGLAVILLSGIIFLILSLTGVRKYIATSLPSCLKVAIPAGIGLFIAFIGFQNSGIVVMNQYVCVSIADFKNGGAAVAVPCLVAFIGLILTVVFANCNVKFLRNSAIISAMVCSIVLYYVCALIFGLDVATTSLKVSTVFKDFAEVGLFGAFKGFKSLFSGVDFAGVLSVVMLTVTFCLVDMFDTLGTLYGASAEAGMLDENGDPLNVGEEMLCDSVGTVVGALTGTSTITTFVESSAGVACGARTGLANIVTAALFLLCLFVAPIAQYIPSCATAPALMYVGVLMFKGIKNVDFSDGRTAVTAFMTVIMMVVTYSISNGIMIGAITYTLVTLFTGKFTKKDIVVTVIAALGVLRFAFVTM